MLIEKLFAISSYGHDITLWLLFVLSVLSLTMAMERYFFLRGWQKSTSLATKLVNESIKTGNFQEIQSLHKLFTQNSKDDPGTKLISSYLGKRNSLISDVYHSFIISKKVELEARLAFLASVGSNAPFIGLLGTIFGVMDSFSALGLSTNASAPIVMIGISKALLATAIGLIVAIPAIVCYNFLRRKVTIIMQNFEYIKEGYLLLIKTKLENNTETDAKNL